MPSHVALPVSLPPLGLRREAAAVTKTRSRKAAIRQHDITRVLRAARAAGLEVFGYDIDLSAGRVTVNTHTPAKQENSDADLNWWLEKHGHKIYETR